MKSFSVFTRALVVLVPVGLVALAPSEGYAGDRPLVLRVVNMTPDDASSADSKKCVQTLRDRAAQEHSELKPITETPLRKLIGAEDKSESFLAWTFEKTKPATKDVDALLAVDCRPEQKTFDALLVNKTGARIQIRLRGEKLDTARSIWLADEILRNAWAGFDL